MNKTPSVKHALLESAICIWTLELGLISLMGPASQSHCAGRRYVSDPTPAASVASSEQAERDAQKQRDRELEDLMLPEAGLKSTVAPR